MWKKNSWTRREDGGGKKHETESEGENCRLYIYSGKTAPKELMILDGEEEKERKREREREEERTEKKKQKKNIRLTEQPSVTVGRHRQAGQSARSRVVR